MREPRSVAQPNKATLSSTKPPQLRRREESQGELPTDAGMVRERRAAARNDSCREVARAESATPGPLRARAPAATRGTSACSPRKPRNTSGCAPGFAGGDRRCGRSSPRRATGGGGSGGNGVSVSSETTAAAWGSTASAMISAVARAIDSQERARNVRTPVDGAGELNRRPENRRGVPSRRLWPAVVWPEPSRPAARPRTARFRGSGSRAVFANRAPRARPPAQSRRAATARLADAPRHRAARRIERRA